MRLKTLEIHGFKSFPEKTVITFDKGITVIVGPNGSGKSNISDAMRWVLGEMSTKSMRGTKMEDVIFAGSQKRSPMGFAEVTIIFDNSGEDGSRIESMAEYDEISVSRRYYRTGDSEYFINRKQVRLRDVLELFMNTGLGKGGYSIIGQGKISEIISQKNEERRAVFEEAAGISKYRYKKVEAMRKLDATNTNLASAEIILSELEGRVKPLEKEAEKARKYLEIYESKKATDIALSLFDIDAAKLKVDDYSSKLAVSRAALENLDETLASLEASYNATYDALMQSKEDSERNIIEMGEMSARAKEAEAEIRVAETSNKHYAEMAQSSKSKLEEEESFLDTARAEYERLSRELRESEENIAALKARMEENLSEIKLKTAESSDIDAQINEANDMMNAAKAAEVEARVSASVALERKNASEGKSAELLGDIEKHRSDIELYEKRIKSAEDKIADYDKRVEEIKSKLDEIDAKKADIENRRRELAERKNTFYLEISTRKHKIQNFIRMEELLDGYSSAVRFIVNEHKAGKIVSSDGSKAKIYGPVSKLIEVDKKYATALETAFGATLQNIVVENEETAKAVISYLKKKNAGRATLYPITSVRGRELDADAEKLTSHRGFVSVASKLVGVDGRYSDIIKSIVGRVVVADNLDNATSMAKSTGYKFKIVTLDGQVINAGGSFTGGSVSHDGGMLSRRAQIDKLNAEIAEIEKKSRDASADEEKLDEESENLKKESGVVIGSATVLKTLKDAESTQLEILKSKLGDIKDSMQKLSEERDILGLRAEKDAGDIEALMQKEQECKDKQDSLSERIVRLGGDKDDVELEIEELKIKRSELEVELAKLEKQAELKGEVAKDSKERLDIRVQNLEKERESSFDINAKIAENEAKIKEYLIVKEDAERKQRELAERKSEISGSSDKYEKRLSEIKTKQSDAQHTRQLTFEECTKLESAHTQMLEKRDSLVSFLWETYELTYSAANALGYEKLTPEARHEAVALQTKYKNIMRSLGNVNVNSIEEYKEVKERYEYYSTQIADLHASRKDLEEIISSLEERMKEDFKRTFDEINTNFGKVFAELFGGGRAELRLTDPSNVLDCGIEINVAPPGKIIKSLSLLSGGEQSFVAIALYFSILKVNPAPFCIMDEIESALDEINVDKFADYVKNYCDRTQFVLITHRRGTMEAAERLYGVTMREKGISDVISIDVSEIATKIGAELN